MHAHRKLLLLLASSLLCVAGLAASADAAPRDWRINGRFLPQGQQSVVTATSKSKLTYTESGVFFELDCTTTETKKLNPGGVATVESRVYDCTEIRPVHGRVHHLTEVLGPKTGDNAPRPEDIARPPQLTPEQSLALGGEMFAASAPPGMLGDPPPGSSLSEKVQPVQPVEGPIELEELRLVPEEESPGACEITGTLVGAYNDATQAIEYPEEPLSPTSLTGSGCSEVSISGEEPFSLEGGGTVELAEETPEIGRCVKTARGAGGYSGATCTTRRAGGNYEWEPGPGAKPKFTSALEVGTRVTFETVAHLKLTCSGEAGEGEYTSWRTISAILNLTGCESAGQKCTGAGETEEGDISIGALFGLLDFEKDDSGSPTKSKVGLELFAPQGAFMEYSCGSTSVQVAGTIIDNVSANKMLAGASLKWTGGKGRQKPNAFEGEAVDAQSLWASVDGAPFEEAGLTLTSELTSEEKVELSSFR